MNNNIYPWDAISVPQSNLASIRVDHSHVHDFSWGKDSTGKLLLILTLVDMRYEDVARDRVELIGISVDIRKVHESGTIFLQLTLLSQENTDIFHTLCMDLIERTRLIAGTTAALEVLYQRLDLWRTFLSKSNKALLTRQEVQGLYAELYFLEDCLDQGYITQLALLDGWQGPLGAPHDFILGSEAVEIKSVSGSYVDSVRISNEGQLTTHLDSLYLHVVFVSQDMQCNGGTSLNSLINRIRGKLDIDVLPMFLARLFESGYIDIPEYDRPYFSVIESKTYVVSDGFPRLTPNVLPLGIFDVSYLIALSNIENFLVKDFRPGVRERT